jgi:hypothetical protein
VTSIITIARGTKTSRTLSVLIPALRRLPRIICVAVALVATLAARDCLAATNLAINPSLSHVTLSGYVDNFDPPLQNVSEPITAQSPGSLTAGVTGTLSVNVNPANQLSISTLQIAVQTTPGLFTPGNVPANFAGQIVNPEYGGNSIGYIAGLVMSLTGNNLPLAPDGSFAASQLSAQFINTTLTWQTASISFIGTGTESGPFTNVSNGTGQFLASSPTNEQLTIPIDLEVTVPAAGQLAHFEFQGQIVASVPEPATGSLVAAGAGCALLAIGWRRLRARGGKIDLPDTACMPSPG